MAVNANSRERIGGERAWRGLKSGGTEVGKLTTLHFLGWSEVVGGLGGGGGEDEGFGSCRAGSLGKFWEICARRKIAIENGHN